MSSGDYLLPNSIYIPGTYHSGLGGLTCTSSTSTKPTQRELRLGDRVMVKGSFAGRPMDGEQGVVIAFNPSSEVGVEFDNSFSSGHDCAGKARADRGRWGSEHELKLIENGSCKKRMETRLKTGDRILNTAKISPASPNAGKLGVVTLVGTNSFDRTPIYYIRYDDGERGQGGSEYYKLVTKDKKTIMNRVSIMMKKLLDARTQKFVKAGFIDGDLDITTDGIRTLNRIMFFEKGAEMEAEADVVIAEAEKSKEE